MKTFHTPYRAWLVGFCLILQTCQPDSSPKNSIETNTTQTSEIAFKYAKGLKIEYFKSYTLLQLFRNTREARDTLQFVLLRRGTAIPKGFTKNQIIEVPVRGLIPLSTTFLEPLDRLGLNDKVLAVENKAFITHEKILARVNSGELPEVSSQDQLDEEKILSLNPDLIMTSGFSSGKSLASLEKMGLKIIPNLDWQESSPLGRAEWVKFIALFFDKEAEAIKIFEEIESAYLNISRIAGNVDKKPTVLLELPFKDTWYVSGGKSFMAQLIKDAGATYYWASDSTTGAIPLDLETVYPIGLKADFWINVGTAEKKQDIQAVDPRLADFAAFKNNHIFNNNLRQNKQGGNDYWNSGVLNPHLVLSDLVKIFHPELLPDYQFTYYRQINN